MLPPRVGRDHEVSCPSTNERVIPHQIGTGAALRAQPSVRKLRRDARRAARAWLLPFDDSEATEWARREPPAPPPTDGPEKRPRDRSRLLPL